MPNTFIALDVPRGDGVGTPAVVSLTGHPKTFVLNGPVAGRYIVEGSCDGGKTWDILVDDDDGTKIFFTSDASGLRSADCVVEQVRVRSERNDGAEPPSINMGAPPANGANFFGTLDVPEVPGLGSPLELGLNVGPLKTVILRGTVSAESRLSILASMDGDRFDEVFTFTADQQGARSRQVMCRFLRVQRSGAAGPPPVVAVGGEALLEVPGTGAGLAPLTIASDEKRETRSRHDEEVLCEYAVPLASLVAPALVADFSGLLGAVEGSARFRIRLGGTPGEPDGEKVLTVKASGAESLRTRRSRPFRKGDRSSALVKLTGQGRGAVVRGFVLLLSPTFADDC